MFKLFLTNKIKSGALLALLLCISLTSNHAFAKTRLKMESFEYIFTETKGVYYLGTTESLEVAKKTIIEMAKKESADFSGTYVDKQFSLSNEKILKDEINFYSFSLIRLDDYSDEKFITKEGVIGLKYNVMMSLKKTSIKEGLKEIKDNIILETKFKKLQAKHDILVNMLTKNNGGDYLNKKTIVDNLDGNSKSTAILSSIKSIKDLKKEADIEYKVSKKYLYKIFNEMVDKAKVHIDSFDVKLGGKFNYGLTKYHLSIDDSEFKTALAATLPNLIQLRNDGSITNLDAMECNFENEFSANNYNECRLYDYVKKNLKIAIVFRGGGVRTEKVISSLYRKSFAIKGNAKLLIPLHYDGTVNLDYNIY